MCEHVPPPKSTGSYYGPATPSDSWRHLESLHGGSTIEESSLQLGTLSRLAPSQRLVPAFNRRQPLNQHRPKHRPRRPCDGGSAVGSSAFGSSAGSEMGEPAFASVLRGLALAQPPESQPFRESGAATDSTSPPCAGPRLPDSEHEVRQREQEQASIVAQAVAASREWMSKPSSVLATPWGRA